MKKLVLIVLVFLSLFVSATSSRAQLKIAYVNYGELVAAMPETQRADSLLKLYQDSLNNIGTEYYKEFLYQDSIFAADSAGWTPTKRDIKRADLQTLYQRVQNWQQIAQQYYSQREQQFIAPIRDKAEEAIQAVAKQTGYSYVLDRQVVIVGPPGDDIIGLVKKHLRIPDKPATANK